MRMLNNKTINKIMDIIIEKNMRYKTIREIINRVVKNAELSYYANKIISMSTDEESLSSNE